MIFADFDAVLFDMDGTLVDSERFTERAVARVLEEEGVDRGDLDLTGYYGIT